MDKMKKVEKAPSSHSPRALVDRGERARWWRRRGSPRRGFWYVDARGERLCDEKKLARIRSLVIPPAWQEVRIAPTAKSRLQAVGVDTSDRIQYLYHAEFSQAQQQKKYAKVERFGERLPLLRRQTNEHIVLDGLPREKVLAVVVRLINDLYFRLGSEDSVRRYRTYGVTTLRNRHCEITQEGQLLFKFIGKHHIAHRRLLVDCELAGIVAEIKALGGSKLFQYRDANGKPKPILPRDVNQYIKAVMGPEFSAKDFRTWGGTLLAAVALAEMGKPENEKEAKRNMVQATKRVAERLGNTPAVCRSSYIHPVVFERYAQGVTLTDFRRKAQRSIKRLQPDYELEELELLKLFQAQREEGSCAPA